MADERRWPARNVGGRTYGQACRRSGSRIVPDPVHAGARQDEPSGRRARKTTRFAGSPGSRSGRRGRAGGPGCGSRRPGRTRVVHGTAPAGSPARYARALVRAGEVGRAGHDDLAGGSTAQSPYVPGGRPASGLASLTRISRAGPLARARTRSVARSRWWPSAMSDAKSRSSAACSQIGLGWRGSSAAIPLPRCVLSLAPAGRAFAIVAPSAAVWPRAIDDARAGWTLAMKLRGRAVAAVPGLSAPRDEPPTSWSSRKAVGSRTAADGRPGSRRAREERPLEVDAQDHPGRLRIGSQAAAMSARRAASARPVP